MSDSATNAPLAAAQLHSRSLFSTRRQPLSYRERYVLWAVLPLIGFSPWHAGSMLWWSNSVNLVLALLPVIVAFGIPLTEEFAEQTELYSRRQNFKNLLKFPIFWLGLLFLGYSLIQALNYNWEFVWTEGRRGFYMQALEEDRYIHWLPSGMKSPFKMTNGWQMLMQWAAPWLAVCALWSTFKRRKAWCSVLWAVAVVGALIAVLGIAAQLTAPDKILWIWEKPARAESFGPFTYRNQANIYLYMAIAASVALFFHYQRTSSIDSGIQWFALLLGGLSFWGSILSFSRAGWIGAAIILLASCVLLFFRILWQRHEGGLKSLLLKGLLFVVAAAGIASLGTKVDFSLMEKKWSDLGKELRGEEVKFKSLSMRHAVALKTLEMFGDNKWTGWGAGSFRFYFVVYQQGDDALTYQVSNSGRYMRNKRFFWRYAHSDWAQILAEYGIIGSSFLLMGLFYWWGSLLLRLRQLHCEHWILIVASVTMVSQSALDIVFYNPALVIVFSMILCAARGLLVPPQPRRKTRSLSAADAAPVPLLPPFVDTGVKGAQHNSR